MAVSYDNSVLTKVISDKREPRNTGKNSQSHQTAQRLALYSEACLFLGKTESELGRQTVMDVYNEQ